MAQDKWAQYAEPKDDKWSQYAEPVRPTEKQQAEDLPEGGPFTPKQKNAPLTSTQMSFGALGGKIPTAEQAENITETQKQVPGIVSGIRKNALAMGGGSLGRFAPTVLTRIGTAGAGAAIGTGAGSLASGELPDPKEMAKTGLGFSIGTAIGEAVGPTLKLLFGPFLQKSATPATEAALNAGITQKQLELGNMADAEEGIRKSVVAAPNVIRRNVMAKIYPQVNEMVNVGDAGKEAVSQKGQQIAHGLPGELRKTVRIGQQVQAVEGYIRELISQDRSLSSDPMQQAELLDAMQLLKDGREISFSQAKNLRSALGSAIARGQGYKLPSETYNALRSVHDLVEKGLFDAADRAGVLAQYKAADKIYSQFMNDFFNKNAPLKGIKDFKEGMTGSTLRRLVASGPRAVEALRRWGMKDQADALQKIFDTPNLTGKDGELTKMVELNRSPKAFRSEALTAAKEADAAAVAKANAQLSKQRWTRLKIGAGLVGLGGIGAYERMKAQQKP